MEPQSGALLSASPISDLRLRSASPICDLRAQSAICEPNLRSASAICEHPHWTCEPSQWCDPPDREASPLRRVRLGSRSSSARSIRCSSFAPTSPRARPRPRHGPSNRACGPRRRPEVWHGPKHAREAAVAVAARLLSAFRRARDWGHMHTVGRHTLLHDRRALPPIAFA